MNKKEDIKLILCLKHGSMLRAYEEWMYNFDDTPFTQEESDYIANYAKETNRSDGTSTYDYN